MQEAVADRIVIQIYKGKTQVDLKRYRDPPKRAAEILRRLQDSQLLGDLRDGDDSLSGSDMMYGNILYKLYCDDKAGVIQLKSSYHSHIACVLEEQCGVQHMTRSCDTAAQIFIGSSNACAPLPPCAATGADAYAYTPLTAASVLQLLQLSRCHCRHDSQ